MVYTCDRPSATVDPTIMLFIRLLFRPSANVHPTVLSPDHVPLVSDRPYNDCMAMVFPPQMMPCLFYSTRIEKPDPPEDGRRFLLDRSVFDLVNASQFLQLTDPKLLGWYLSLPSEDRKIIQDEGGFQQFLQRHPALTLAKHHVYVKCESVKLLQLFINNYNLPRPIMSSSLNKSRRPTFYGVTLCVTCGKSCPSGAKHCRRCNTPIEHETLCPADREFDLLPNHVRENLTLLGCCGGSNSKDGAKCQGAQKQPGEDQRPTNQLVNLQDSFQTAYNRSPVAQEPCHQEGPLLSQLWEEGASWQRDSSVSVCEEPSDRASFSLDVELERHRQTEKQDLGSRSSVIQGQSGYNEYDKTSQLHSEWPTIEQETPKYYSFDSTQMDWAECSDTSMIQSAEPEQDGGTEEAPPGPAEATEDSCQDHLFYRGDLTYSVHDSSANTASGEWDEASSGGEGRDANFHSIMEDDESILMCKAGERLRPRVSGVCSAPVTPRSGTPLPSRVSTAERSTSPMPRATTCDVSVATEPSVALCTPAVTQTEGPSTADKHVVTEVHMADLDYLAEEFVKLNAAQEELKQLKEKMTRCCIKDTSVLNFAEGGCGCVQRAQRAELCLLALQYSMCRQHCWRIYHTSADEQQLTLMPEGPPANLVSVLQRLESGYNEMREKILAGAPLDQLKPLSVDSQKIPTGTCYIPAQIIGDALGNVPARSSQQPHRQDNGGLHGQNSKEGQRRKDQAPQPKVEGSKPGKAVSLLPQQSAAACKELNPIEAWYDAEEDLEPAGAAAAAGTGEASAVMPKEEKDESSREVKNGKSSLLCVSDLPSNVTESEVMQWFEKYHASEVSISTFSNDLRVAIVRISGPQSAEAAVRELNGCSMRGHALHVEHISGAGAAGSQSRDQQPPASSSTNRPGSSEPQNPKTHSNTAVKLVPQQLLCSSLEKRTVVCVSPTPKGTCVPQHYGTMGSFDTLMAELTRRHPEVGRLRIMDALLELRAKHRGVLSGLPLRIITEMTSELLTRPTSAALS
uniref:RNA-binding protein 44 n=1 Tax=Centroberyx gerrardi TaxID=166262 RepID=UPI003AAB7B61